MTTAQVLELAALLGQLMALAALVCAISALRTAQKALLEVLKIRKAVGGIPDPFDYPLSRGD